MKTYFFNKLARVIRESYLLARGDSLLIGLSGGPDSLALAQTLWRLSFKYEWKITALHVNHLLRGKSSDADERFVRTWASHNNCPLLVERADVAAYRLLHRLSPEEAARALRYSLLETAAKAIGANKIVLAHTADDQAETVLWRLLRGSVGGLAGIPASRPISKGSKISVVRPFLSVRKRDILHFLKEQKLSYREDSSNRNNAFVRNKVRNTLIPYLEKHFNPSIVQTLNLTAQNLRHRRNLIESLTQDIVNGGIIRSEDSCRVVDVQALNKIPEALRVEVFKKALESAGANLAKFRQEHVQRFLALTRSLPSSKQMMIGHIRIRREQGRIVFTPLESHRRGFPTMTLKIPGDNAFPGGVLHTALQKKQGDVSKLRAVIASQRRSTLQLDHPFLSMREFAKRILNLVVQTTRLLRPPKDFGVLAMTKESSYREYFDWNTLTPPLTLRTRKPQDRYQPIGLEGTKKLKDIFIDRKVPLSQRDQVPVLTDATGKILWLAGYRIAEFCKVQPDTRNVLAMQIELEKNLHRQ